MSPSPAIPVDPELPLARDLFEGRGAAAIGSFLGKRGWHLEEARPVQAIYRPGRSCLVRYRARAQGPAGSRILTLCAETGAEEPRVADAPGSFGEGFVVPDPVERQGGLLVWAYPYDPSLAELPEAASGRSVREAAGADAISVQPLRYRPRRRGVFRYRELHAGRRWRTSFGKVIPSRKAERTVVASRALESAGVRTRAPHRLGRQTLIVPEVGGESLRDILVSGGSLPSPDRVARLIRHVQLVGSGRITWRRPSPVSSAAPASELILALLPGLRPEVERVMEAVGSDGSAPVGPSVVHGDLYEAQVLVGERYSLGLIDLDDVGLGDPVMDAASFCAHLLALAMSVPSASRRLMAYRELARDAFARRLQVSRSDLAWREALCMLRLATGPFRVLDPRWPEEVGRRVKGAVRLLDGG